MTYFKQIATQIAAQLSQLLAARVSVADQSGAIVALSDSLATSEPLETTNLLRVPIQLEGQTGEVLIAASTHGEVISPRPAQTLVELLVNQATATQVPHPPELKHKFIHDLLRGTALSEGDFLREGQIWGMDLTRPRSVILIDAAAYILPPIGLGELELTSQIWRRAQLIIGSVVRFFHLPNDTICAYIGDGEIAVLKASSTQDLAAWATRITERCPVNASWANLSALKQAGNALLERLRSETQTVINLGIGRYHPRLSGLAHSYQDARAALSLGKQFHGSNRVHCLDSLGIAAFVGIADPRTKVDLARYLLSPLDQEAELLETLDVFFFENCCFSLTANRLSIHRNTLSYRLEKITSLTGLDPRRFEDAIQIRLALFLRSFRAEGGQLCKCPISPDRDQAHPMQITNESLNSSLQYK